MFRPLGQTGLRVQLIDGPANGQAIVELENEPEQLWQLNVFECAPGLVFLSRL